MKRWLVLWLLCCLLPCAAMAVEGAYLPATALEALEPAMREFLQEMAELLIANDLLLEEDRESWILYQLGDYYQNGGYGAIMITYTPGLIQTADDTVSMREFVIDTPAGTLRLSTLRRYSEHYSILPGLPLDTELTDPQGVAVPCRFRWSASGGSFSVWDGTQGAVVDVGAVYTNDGKPLYWYAQPLEGIEEALVLEILAEDEEDTVLATVRFAVFSGENEWTLEEMP